MNPIRDDLHFLRPGADKGQAYCVACNKLVIRCSVLSCAIIEDVGMGH